MKVRDVMVCDVVTLNANDPLVAAEEIMGLRRFRHLPVTDKGVLIGLVTHRDLLRAYVSSLHVDEDRVANEILKASVNVRKIMHTRVQVVHPHTPLSEAAHLLHQGKYGCLPVVDDAHRLVGILTEADFVRMVGMLLDHVAGDDAFMERLEASLASK